MKRKAPFFVLFLFFLIRFECYAHVTFAYIPYNIPKMQPQMCFDISSNEQVNLIKKYSRLAIIAMHVHEGNFDFVGVVVVTAVINYFYLKLKM